MACVCEGVAFRVQCVAGWRTPESVRFASELSEFDVYIYMCDCMTALP